MSPAVVKRVWSPAIAYQTRLEEAQQARSGE
jgi:hypothetical protein